jgi:hypothetical protein
VTAHICTPGEEGIVHFREQRDAALRDLDEERRRHGATALRLREALRLPPTGFEYLLEFFDAYDYRRPLVEESRLDYRLPDNVVGHQQRCVNVWWAIEQCWRTGGVGLEVGSGGVHTPWCLSTDGYSGESHPTYGGTCRPHMVAPGEDLSVFADGSFSLVLGNHVVEHLDGDAAEILRAHWLRVLRPGGILAVVLPDQEHVDVMRIDASHRHAWTAAEFLDRVVGRLLDVGEIIEFDTLQNHFSYQAVLRRR